MTREEILSIAKPILFNTDMVRAILDDRKTVTRRLIKSPYFVDGNEDDPRTIQVLRTAPKGSQLYKEIGEMPYPRDPYRTGHYIYVRETWANVNTLACPCYYYRASEELPDWALGGWKPSIHMPKEAARIFLRVTDVRVERLQAISGYGVLAEGVDNRKSNPAMGIRWENMQRTLFQDVWNSTISKKDMDQYGWVANPWVWVIEFERVEVQ